MKCPYCGAEAVLRNTKYIYKDGNNEDKVYVCSNYPKCDSYVGCHKGTAIPKGNLANKELRVLRIKAHNQLNSMQEKLGISRRNTYKYLSDLINVSMENCHIGHFDKDMCNTVISACSSF